MSRGAEPLPTAPAGVAWGARGGRGVLAAGDVQLPRHRDRRAHGAAVILTTLAASSCVDCGPALLSRIHLPSSPAGHAHRSHQHHHHRHRRHHQDHWRCSRGTSTRPREPREAGGEGNTYDSCGGLIEPLLNRNTTQKQQRNSLFLLLLLTQGRIRRKSREHRHSRFDGTPHTQAGQRYPRIQSSRSGWALGLHAAYDDVVVRQKRRRYNAEVRS